MLTDAQRQRILSCPRERVDMVLDTDAYNEIDDQFALSMALLEGKKLNLEAVYAAPFFNERSQGPGDGMERSYREILHLFRLAGREVPAFRGAEGYLENEATPRQSDAARDLCRRAMAHSPENPLYAVAIGAITNVASALLLQPEIADRMVIVWLGGHGIHWIDNHEFNCFQDVAAARVVMGSGAPLVILPCMGVVSAFTATGPELEYWLRDRNTLCDYLCDHTIEAAEEYAKGKPWSRVIWDVTAIGWLLNDQDSLMDSRLIPTPIPEYDHHYSFDDTRPLCRYVYHIHRDALMERMIGILTGGNTP